MTERERKLKEIIEVRRRLSKIGQKIGREKGDRHKNRRQLPLKEKADWKPWSRERLQRRGKLTRMRQD